MHERYAANAARLALELAAAPVVLATLAVLVVVAVALPPQAASPMAVANPTTPTANRRARRLPPPGRVLVLVLITGIDLPSTPG